MKSNDSLLFSKLNLTHTCCRKRSHSGFNYFECKMLSDEDVTKIRAEEEELLTHLEVMLQQLSSAWWTLSSKMDFLLDMEGFQTPPTLQRANLWLSRRNYGHSRQDLEQIRIDGDMDEDFWDAVCEMRMLSDEFSTQNPSSNDNETVRSDVARRLPIAFCKNNDETWGAGPCIVFK